MKEKKMENVEFVVRDIKKEEPKKLEFWLEKTLDGSILLMVYDGVTVWNVLKIKFDGKLRLSSCVKAVGIKTDRYGRIIVEEA